jgi:transcription-repair coupling factor (superfamily II helicase)
MILPAVRERLERLLRLPSLEGSLAELRSNANLVSLSGLQDVAKALVAAYLSHELRRPAFFITDSNRRAESLAESLLFFFQIFPGHTGGVAVLPAFDSLPWDPQSPHADILERRAATLYRLADGEVSLVIAPVASALWRYQDPYVYLTLARTLAKDAEVSHEELITHLASTGYARTEMVDLPGQFAVRGGIVDVFSPEAARPVRLELLGDTIEGVREFDPRTQRSVAPVVKTTILPLTEWSVPAPGSNEALNWEPTGWIGGSREAGTASLFELAESSLKPLVFLDEPVNLRESARKHVEAATENYERHGQANAPEASHYFWSEPEFDRALLKGSRIELEQLSLITDGGPRFELASRPTTRFHGDVVACFADIKSQLAAGGTAYLTAASLGELERFADICREYEVPYVLGETEEAATGFTAENASETAALVLLRAPFSAGVAFPEAKVTLYGNADLRFL